MSYTPLYPHLLTSTTVRTRQLHFVGHIKYSISKHGMFKWHKQDAVLQIFYADFALEMNHDAANSSVATLASNGRS